MTYGKETKKIIRKLLCMAKRAGYTRVAIHMRDPNILACRHWPFSYVGSVFAGPSTHNKNCFPPIWEICEKLGVAGGSGNSDQHSLRLDCEPASWRLVGGKWKKVG
jgi:hypothetical protein